jgi:hypothetical protein
MITNYLNVYDVVKQHQTEMERSAQLDLQVSLANPSSPSLLERIRSLLDQVGKLLMSIGTTMDYGPSFRNYIQFSSFKAPGTENL